MKPTKDSKQMLFEMMGKLDSTFSPKAEILNEWNFDKKKGEDKKSDEDDESKEHEDKEKKVEKSGKKKYNFEKKEDSESEEHEESETSDEEKEEHKDKEELDEVKPKTKVPVNMVAKVGGVNEEYVKPNPTQFKQQNETDGYGVGADDGSDEAAAAYNQALFGAEAEYGPLDTKQIILSLLSFVRDNHDYNPSILADVVASKLQKM